MTVMEVSPVSSENQGRGCLIQLCKGENLGLAFQEKVAPELSLGCVMSTAVLKGMEE